MKTTHCKAVIVRGTDLLDFFCDNLQKVLTRLGAEYQMVSSQAEAIENIDHIDMIMIDPSVRDFNPSRLSRAGVS